MASKTDGTLWSMGSNTVGQLANGNTTDVSSPTQIASGGNNWKKVINPFLISIGPISIWLVFITFEPFRSYMRK